MKRNFISLSNVAISIYILVAWWLTFNKINPFLHYHIQKIGFSTNSDFFYSFLLYPGGISNYLAEFISQFFYFNLLGSTLIVAIASVQGLITLNIVNRLSEKTKLGFLFFATTLILGVVVLFNYNCPYYIVIRLLFAYLFTWIFHITDKKYPARSIYLWPLMAILLFLIASGAALIAFAISTILILLYSRPKRYCISRIPVIILFTGLLPLIASTYIFPMNLTYMISLSEAKPPEMLSYNPSYQVYIYYAILPAILLSVLILNLVMKDTIVSHGSKGRAKSKASFFKKTIFSISLQVIGCTVFGYFLFIRSEEPFQRKLLLIDYYAETEQWNKILEVAESIELYDFNVNYQVNRAYAHLGLLPENLFNYPQLKGSKGLFLDDSFLDSKNTMANSDLYFDLGYMDESQHWAFEAQTVLPEGPHILKRLATINIINSKYDIAKKYLNVLNTNILYTDWVDKYEKYISDTLSAAQDLVIAQKRLFTPKENVFILNPYENLKLLLKTNKNNRLAYDYLITLCILDKNFDEFIKYIQDYPYYNIKKLPRSWEEALSAYIYKYRTVPSFVTSETISKECRQRLNAFNETLGNYNYDKNAAQSALKQNFENTFWYYLFYINVNTKNISNK